MRRCAHTALFTKMVASTTEMSSSQKMTTIIRQSSSSLAASWWKKNNHLLCLSRRKDEELERCENITRVIDEDTITKANTATLEEVEFNY